MSDTSNPDKKPNLRRLKLTDFIVQWDREKPLVLVRTSGNIQGEDLKSLNEKGIPTGAKQTNELLNLWKTVRGQTESTLIPADYSDLLVAIIDDSPDYADLMPFLDPELFLGISLDNLIPNEEDKNYQIIWEQISASLKRRIKKNNKPLESRNLVIILDYMFSESVANNAITSVGLISWMEKNNYSFEKLIEEVNSSPKATEA